MRKNLNIITIGAALLLSSSVLTSCGFEPVYADRTVNVTGELSDIQIIPIVDPKIAGFELEKALRERFDTNDNVSSRYQLAIRLREKRETLAVTENANVIRFNYTLTADYVLTDFISKKRKKGRVSTTTGYGVVASQFATLVGEEESVRKASIDIANKLNLELALYIKGAEDIKISPTAPPETEPENQIGPAPQRLEQAPDVQIDEPEEDDIIRIPTDNL